MRQPYSTTYWPPAPVLDVALAVRYEAPRVGPFPALADTGADGSLAPLDLLNSLGIPATDETGVRSLFGGRRQARVFLVDLLVGETRLPDVEIVGIEDVGEIILGRDVLNQLLLLLDGPGGLTDVLERRPRLRSR
ncbi:MAG: retropepsin-like domain-containing protein [Chloroflexi bacterium]|nr:retropepsin-like domain-containing protein [Chloroflexota bacterium]